MTAPYLPSPAIARDRLVALMQVRGYTIEDAPSLAELYRDSARGLGAQAYSPAQIAAWVRYPDDYADFCERLQRGVSLVSMEGDEIAAFGQLYPDDYISLLYTATRFARRGHATNLYQHLEAAARSRHALRLSTIASRLSRPLFAKLGFELVEVERNIHNGVEFERYKMAKYFRGDG